MLAEKLAADIANAVEGKMAEKTAISLGSLGRAARNIGLAGMGATGLAGAGYAYTPEIVDGLNNAYHSDEGMLAGLARKGRRAAIYVGHSGLNAGAYATYLANRAGIEGKRMLTPSNTMVDKLNYHLLNGINRGQYEMHKAITGVPYREAIIRDAIDHL